MNRKRKGAAEKASEEIKKKLIKNINKIPR